MDGVGEGGGKAGQKAAAGHCIYANRLRSAAPRLDSIQAVTGHCTATVTVFEMTPPMTSTTDTALPVGALSGTCTLTW